MATRTPPLQTRSQFQRSWGNFASATALPNASGAPLSAPFFSILEVGDTAYSVADGATYTCTNVGTAGGGDAVWSSGGGGSGSDTLTSVRRTVMPISGGSGTDAVMNMNAVSIFANAAIARTTVPNSATWLARQNRNACETATTSQSTAGKRTDGLWALGSPSRTQVVFGLLGSAIANMRVLIGLLAGQSSYLGAGTDPSSSLIPAGVYLGLDSTDANLQLMHKAGAVVAQKINLGAAFARAANMALRFELDLSPGRVDYRVTRLDAPGTASGTLIAHIPADASLLFHHWQCATNATGTQVAAIDCVAFEGQNDIS